MRCAPFAVQRSFRHPFRILATALLLTVALGLGACGDDVTTEEAGPVAGEMTAAELGRLGARLDQEPDRAEAILEEAGITWEEFEAAVREISADAGSAREYAEAFAEAGGETPTGAGEAAE